MDSANSAFLSGTGQGINIESIENPFGDIESRAKVFNVGEAVSTVFNVKTSHAPPFLLSQKAQSATATSSALPLALPRH